MELLSGWEAGESSTPESIAVRDLLLDAAVVLNARQVKLAAFGSPLPSIEPLVQPLRLLCDRAERRGVRLALEPMPFGLVATVDKMAELLEAVDRPGTFGVFIDSWQFFRAGNDLQSFERMIDVRSVFGVELSDAGSEVQGTLIDDTIHHRLLPGQGSLDLVGFVSTLSRMGWRGPWGVEIMSDTHRKLPLVDALTVAHDAAKGVIVRSLGKAIDA